MSRKKSAEIICAEPVPVIETNDTISAIAWSTGFCDHSHFVREFTRLIGTSPGAYRKRLRPL